MILRDVAEGGRIPTGYRCAWRKLSGANVFGPVHVCAPFGLHWLLRLGYRLWALSFRFRPTAHERALAKAHEAGRAEAHREMARMAEWDQDILSIMDKMEDQREILGDDEERVEEG